MTDDLPEKPDDDAVSDRPQGLVGLITWPFQVLVFGAIRLAFGLVEGIIRALLAPLTGGQSADPGSGQDKDDQSSR